MDERPRMPRKQEWIHRLPEILNADVPAMVDRRVVESLFSLSPRQANRVLHQLGATAAGGAMVLERGEFVRRLRQVQGGEAVQQEQRRRDKLARTLEAARWEAHSRQISIPVSPPIGLADLPSGVTLEPGRLDIRFSNPVELLQMLMSIVRAISEDWNGYLTRTQGEVEAE